MGSRRWLVLGVGIALVAVVGAWYALPEIARRVAIARIQAITNRPVRIEGVRLNLLTGLVTVRGFRLGERGGGAAFADFERLDVRLHLPSLLRGHLLIRAAVLRSSTVRVVRSATGFNFSDLIEGSGTKAARRPLDVTVERFALIGGKVTLEDRALPEWRAWTSEHIAIAGENVSTRRDDGRAAGTSVTAGAPLWVEVQRLRLYPVHLETTVTAADLDLALARLYLPADAPVVLERARASSSIRVTLDARAGIRAAMTAQLRDIVLTRPEDPKPLALVPRLNLEATDFVFQDGRFELGRFEATGSANVRDPRAGEHARYQVSAVRASIADLTWPVTTPGRLDVVTAVPGGGTAALSGTVRPAPAPSQLRLRLADVDLAPWTRLLPLPVRIHGVGDVDLRVNEPLAVGVPTRVLGTVAVSRLAVRDDRKELASAQRVEATGLEVKWPERVTVKRLLVTGPRGTVERDRAGAFPVGSLFGRGGPPDGMSAPAEGGRRAAAPPTLNVVVGEIVVRDGAVAWRDAAVTPPARLDVSRIEATVTGAGWPLRGPLGVRAAVSPPGGGHLQLMGRMGVDPFAADLRIAARGAELAPYQAYVPISGQVTGRADLDLAVALPPLSEGRATARGTAALWGVDLRDEQRTVIKIDRAAASGLDIDWPKRVAVGELALDRPWVLLERDDAGVLPLRALLAPRPSASGAATASASGNDRNGASGQGVPVTVGRLTVENGGARVVDRSVAPPFAQDLQRLTLRMERFSTGRTGKPAELDLTARAGADGLLRMRGTVGPVGGPLRLDLTGELQGYLIPRTNPYMLRHVAWEARAGSLTTRLRCRIDGDSLDAKTDILLSRLQVARASPRDEAEARIGLPLGMIVALMKDSRGDIHISLPVGGRLNDPRFDFTEVIWSTVRNVAIKAITLPVSWIGRVRLADDSRIQRIDVDPIPFEPGTARPTPEGQEQMTRLMAFLEQMPEVRMVLTPVVSSRDLAKLKQPTLDAGIARLVREARLAPEEAAARLFKERFPERPLPDTADAIRAALAEGEPASTTTVATLATQRIETVRDVLRKAGIDASRLRESKPIEGAAMPSERAAMQDGQVKLDLVEPDGPRDPGRRGPGFLRRLLGATDTDASPARR